MTRKPAAAIGGALLLVAALGQPANAQQLKSWKHGVIEPKGDAGFMWMVGQRDFAAKHGLKLSIVSMKNGSLAHKALLSGELDSIESSPGAAIIAGSRGADIKIVGCDWPAVPHGLMVRFGINKVADLKGKTVAVAAPGSLPNLLLKAMLEQNKIPQSEVKVASLGGDLNRYKAVLAGVADAGIVAAEFMAVAPKDVHMLVRGRDALPNYVRLCLTMTGKTIASRRADAINFIAAEMDALHYTVTQRPQGGLCLRRHAQAWFDRCGGLAAARQAEMDGRRADEGRQSEDADRSRQDHRCVDPRRGGQARGEVVRPSPRP